MTFAPSLQPRARGTTMVRARRGSRLALAWFLGAAVGTGMISAHVCAQADAVPPAASPASPSQPAANDRGTDANGVRVQVRHGVEGRAPSRNASEAVRHHSVAEALSGTRIDLLFTGGTARDVFRALGRAGAVQIVPWYAIAEGEAGFDPAQVIDLELTDVTLEVALETVIDILGRGGGRSTWQIHNGLVEVGLVHQLARESARVTRIYGVADLCLEPPRFASDGADIPTPPLMQWAVQNSQNKDRKTARLVAAELLDFIVQSVEPEAWTKNDAQVAEMARRGEAEEDDVLSFHGQWASMWYRGGDLVVIAPDFVHRRLAGYEPSIQRPVQ